VLIGHYNVTKKLITTVVCCRGPSASPLCLIIIACCPTHPSFNHRWSSFSGRRFQTAEHCRWTSTSASQMSFVGNVWKLISSVVRSPIPL